MRSAAIKAALPLVCLLSHMAGAQPLSVPKGSSQPEANQANRQVGSVNVTDFAGGDATGRTSSTVALQEAIDKECRLSAPRTLKMPRNGVFDLSKSLVVPVGCDDLTITGPGFELTGDPDDVSNPVLLKVSRVDNLTISNAVFDGSRISQKNRFGLVTFSAPMSRLTLVNDVFENGAFNNGIWFYSADTVNQIKNLTGKLAVAVVGTVDDQITLENIPRGLHVGAYIDETDFDDGVYVTRIDAAGRNVIGVNKVISDSIQPATKITFTPAASLTADAVVTRPDLSVDTVANLVVGQTAWSPSGCIPKNDRIQSISGLHVVLEVDPVCRVAAGSAIAFASGISRMTMINDRFSNLGEGLRLKGHATYQALSESLAGSNKMVFACTSGRGCRTGIGLVPGDLTSTKPENGLPANDAVVSRVVNFPASGTYTVTLAKPMTADTPPGPYDWQVSALAGNGYGYYQAYGAWFANRDWLEQGNFYENTWASAVFLANVSDFKSINTRCILNFRQTQSPRIAGCGCEGISTSDHIHVINLEVTGATGSGYALQHVIDASLLGGTYSGNAVDGITICGSQNVMIGGGLIAKDNDQALLGKFAQFALNNDTGNGITLAGSCGYATRGHQTGIIVGHVELYDDQKKHTQYYGLGKGNAQSMETQAVGITFGAAVSGSHNQNGLVSPSLSTGISGAK